MTVDAVMTAIEALAQPKHTKALDHGLRTVGVGLTKLRKIAKPFAPDAALATSLVEHDLYEARVVAYLVDDPKTMDAAHAEKMAKTAVIWGLSHAWATGGVEKAAIVPDLVDDWTTRDDDLLRRCGWLLFTAAAKRRKRPEDAWFLGHLDTVEATLQDEENFVRDAMNTSLMYVGGLSPEVYARCVVVAEAVGDVVVDYGDNRCEAPDMRKHLARPHIRKKAGV